MGGEGLSTAATTSRRTKAHVLGLAGGQSDDLGTKVRESRLDKHSPESEEAALGARNAVLLLERTGVVPEAEANGIGSRDAAGGDDDAEDDQADNRNDFEYREPTGTTDSVSSQRNKRKRTAPATHQNSASPYHLTPKKLKLQMTTRNTVIQTATLMSSRQYWMTRAAAVISYKTSEVSSCSRSSRPGTQESRIGLTVGRVMA